MSRYMLETNTVSFFMRGDPKVTQRVLNTPMSSLCISAITEGELQFGVAKRPEATKLQRAVAEFLKRVEVLSWDSAAAEYYGLTRAEMERRGKVLSPLDLLIGSHAMSVECILVTNDGAFKQLEKLKTEDWSE